MYAARVSASFRQAGFAESISALRPMCFTTGEQRLGIGVRGILDPRFADSKYPPKEKERAFAAPEVTWLGVEEDGQGARMRRTVDGWHKVNIKGEPLRIDDLSTRLTQVAAYRQTVCRVKASDYLLRRINGIEEPVVARAREARAAMIAVATDMISGLHWVDFETLVDLIFARAGWQRISRVGGTQADTDLVLEQPTTGEIAFVQIKSKAAQAVLDDYIGRFRRSGTYDRMFFICHSPTGTLSVDDTAGIHIWAGDRLADAAVKVGLFDWLTERSA